MTIEYRQAEYGDFDIEAVINIALAIRRDAQESIAEYVEWHDAQRSAGRLCVRWLASVEGQVVGSAYVGQSSRLAPEIIAVHVAVHPDYQNRGYGRALLERAEATAAEAAGERVYSRVDEARLRCVRFLERAGYREIDRRWELTLDLTQCDPDGLQPAIDRATSNGIVIASAATLASERDDWKRELHRLYTDIGMDVPGPFPIREVLFEDFETLSLGRRLLSEGFFVALDGEQLVGLTEPQLLDGVPQQISQNLTGVHSDYRGRGIAMALKSQAVIWAIESGYTSIRTDNAQSNASMIAINDRLGFKRDHTTLVYLKDL